MTLEDAEEVMLKLYCESSNLKDGHTFLEDALAIFTIHLPTGYFFMKDKNEDDWITRYFFTGGTMPSANLLLYFQDVTVVNHSLVNGKHYAQTCEEWLKRMDPRMTYIKPIMESRYNKDSATKWTAYWRTYIDKMRESVKNI
ncbi:(S)-coclaurine N-methyltransferase-like [Glycine soja]|uniref:(S)-coclaurine N-methyltransferase-like n=1 Tax=Glycine soja TaxID=3848 RepID=UPI00103FECE2|nr:(S)-coclaurine N-methyltransferase-like [Glycine soja]